MRATLEYGFRSWVCAARCKDGVLLYGGVGQQGRLSCGSVLLLVISWPTMVIAEALLVP